MLELNKVYNINCAEGMKSLDDNSIDLIITDPPYKKEFIYLYDTLGKESKRILKEGSYCFVYCSTEFLPQCINMLNKYLDWFWLFEIRHSTFPRMFQKKIMVMKKPVLAFTKGNPKKVVWFGDLFCKESEDKEFHKWGQAIGFPTKTIEALTDENDVILDPFLGGGTVAVACKLLKRQYIGFEIDKETFEIAQKRILKTNLITPLENFI